MKLDCGDTRRKTITSITAVLLPFVTYLLTPSKKNRSFAGVVDISASRPLSQLKAT
jgi:hypothetical protein